MKSLFCGLAVLVLLACLFRHSFAPADPGIIERTVTKTFSVGPAGVLHVQTNGGAIRVESAPGRVVIIRANETMHAGSEAVAEQMRQRLTLSLTQEGGDVTALAKYAGSRGEFPSNSWPPAQVDFVVTAPPGFAVELDSGGGRISVGDLTNAVRARTGGGELRLGRIGGGVDAQTGGGSVQIDSVASALQLLTGGGQVTAGLAGALQHDSAIETSGGSIHLRGARTAGFDLDADAGGGPVEIDDLPVAIAQGGSGPGKLAGPVRGGGPRLKLRSGGGSIEVLAR